MDGNDSPYVWRDRPLSERDVEVDVDEDGAIHEDEFVIVEGRATTFRDYKR